MTADTAEWEDDKFATLFAPATPRASPTLEQQQEALATTRPRYNHHKSISADSDFGSFVSVSAVDDPLSNGGGDGVGEDGGKDALIDFDSPAQAPPQKQQDCGGDEENNASLEFFDRFGREAKQSSEKNRHSVLDEIIMHEDDPLYFLSDTQNAQDVVDPSSSRESATDKVDDIGSTHKDELARPIDISPNPRRSPESAPQRPSISPTRSSTLALPVTLAPPLADKLNAAANAHIGLDPSDIPQSTSPSPSPPQTSSTSSYSTLTSLSSRLMSSLLSSSTSSNDAINNGKSKASKQGVTTSSLEALFIPGSMGETGDINSAIPATNPREQKQKQKKARSTDRAVEQQPQLYRTSSSSSTSSITGTPTTSHPFFHLPFSQQTMQDVQITHGSPFGRSSTLTKASGSKIGVGTIGSSPFGPHIYIPPTGAPGYRGESYDWDKGYSEDLVRELGDGEQNVQITAVETTSMKVAEVERGRNQGEGQSNIGGTNSRGSSVGGGANYKTNNRSANGERSTEGNGGRVPDVAHLIEKKGGLVQLVARKASTTPVLEVRLADMIRAHFPARARLPKSWSLVYSLDQHGISLNTLYDRCEDVFIRSSTSPAAVAGPVGALLVVKDESGTVFGASLGGEGIRRSRGRGYFGSGDSFLWKFIDGQHLKVFKWTGKNDYVALCEPEFISIGGGDGNYGLYLDDTLYEGSSASCPTFDNEPLCTEEGSQSTSNEGTKISNHANSRVRVAKFECVGLEVWRIGP